MLTLSQLRSLYTTEDLPVEEVYSQLSRWGKEYTIDSKKYMSMLRKKSTVPSEVSSTLRNCIVEDMCTLLKQKMTMYLRKFKLTLKPTDATILEHLSDKTVTQGLDLFDRTFSTLDQYFNLKSRCGSTKRRAPSGFSLFVKASWENEREALNQIVKTNGTSGVMKHLSTQWNDQKKKLRKA